MPTPYERVASAAAPPVASRPSLHRPVEGRVLGGVCAGLAAHLGWPVRLVRIAFLVLLFPFGEGVAAYLFLWALTPQATQTGGADTIDPAVGPRAPGAEPSPRPGRTGKRRGRGVWRASDNARSESEATRFLLLGGLMLLAGAVAVAQQAGLNFRLGLLLPLLVVAGGAVLAWSQLDEAQRGRWLGGDAEARRFSLARVAFGGVLAVVGLVIMATRGRSLSAMWDIGLATLAVLAGAVLIAAPWALRLWSELRREQAERARATERADIAAHLHDSVLQTLAMIQRQAQDPAAVAQLARAQERELRAWLYAAPKDSAASLATTITAAVHEVEDLHGIPIDVVATGDRPLDDGGQALVRAVRESLVNAVRHGAPPISVYVEIGPSGVEAFVRDHGPGFDLDQIAQDRLGVRQSILGRMQRHGGTASVRRLEQGTEITLGLPPAGPSVTAGGSPPEPEPEPGFGLEPAPGPERPDRPAATVAASPAPTSPAPTTPRGLR